MDSPWLTLGPEASVDLQMHTTFSDGKWTAEELLDYVAGEGFALVAVTDHDQVAASAEVRRLGAERGVATLLAAELSSELDGVLLDLLCFGFDPARGTLEAIGAETRRGQLENLQETYATLLRQGYKLPSADEVAARGGSLRDIHDIAALLREGGYTTGLGEIVDKAGFRWITAEPARILEAAHHDGAVCLIAHPGRGDGFCEFDAPALDRFRQVVPVDGLEVRHPSHSAEQVELFAAYAREHGLLVSTGSDSHGKPDQMPIKYPAHISRDLLARLGVMVR
ncbi:MAG TPA: PHP domain-containing protein [Ktedonobacterales bacterium]